MEAHKVCKAYDLPLNAWKYGAWVGFDHYTADSSAGTVEGFEVSILSDDKTLDKLELSDQESEEFEQMVAEVLDDCGTQLFHQLRFPPAAPYRWRLIENESGKHMAVWYQDEDDALPSGYEEEAGNLHLLIW